MLFYLQRRFDEKPVSEFIHTSKFRILMIIAHNRKDDHGSMCQACSDKCVRFMLKNNICTKKSIVAYPAALSKASKQRCLVSPVTSLVHVERYLKKIKDDTGIKFLKCKVNSCKEPTDGIKQTNNDPCVEIGRRRLCSRTNQRFFL